MCKSLANLHCEIVLIGSNGDFLNSPSFIHLLTSILQVILLVWQAVCSQYVYKKLNSCFFFYASCFLADWKFCRVKAVLWNCMVFRHSINLKGWLNKTFDLLFSVFLFFFLLQTKALSFFAFHALQQMCMSGPCIPTFHWLCLPATTMCFPLPLVTGLKSTCRHAHGHQSMWLCLPIWSQLEGGLQESTCIQTGTSLVWWLAVMLLPSVGPQSDFAVEVSIMLPLATNMVSWRAPSVSS